jgi:hypothetical protein
MRKLKDEKKLLWCLKQFYQRKESRNGSHPTLESQLGNSENCMQTYKQTKRLSKSKMGRPKKATPAHWDDLVDVQWKKNRSNALYLEKTIDSEHKQRIRTTPYIKYA